MAYPVIEAVTTQSDSSTQDLDVYMPATVNENDLLLMIVIDDRTAWHAYDAITDWTYYVNDGDGTSDCVLHVFYKLADGTEGGTSQACGNSNYTGKVGWGVRISNVDTTTPLEPDPIVASANIDNATSIDIDGVTTSVAECLAFYMCGFDGSASGFSVSGTGWSEYDEMEAGGAAGCWGTKQVASAGGTGTATVSVGASTNGIAGIQFAVRPGSATSPQYFRPSADVVSGLWEPSPNTPSLYGKINETTASDSEYIYFELGK